MNADNATYLYCLVRSSRAPDTKNAPAGLPNLSRARVLDAGEGLWLVVADAPLAEYDRAPIEARMQDLEWISVRALAHEAVIDHLLEAGTVIPMRLFTLFRDDQRALRHIENDRARLERILARIDGCLEWGLRVQLSARSDTHDRSRDGKEPPPASGREFLLRKKEQFAGRRAHKERAHERAERIYAELASKAAESVRRPVDPNTDRSLLEAAFLVSSDAVHAFRATADEARAAAIEDGCDAVLTGPWPAFHFIERE
ncbi:MAG TPA: GvpL/GvpF family gas vesicle protein [Planctomycetota bacterium]|nr:GvpL/GvpF family gas vesicle protein [Planctomycetota bacterium]